MAGLEVMASLAPKSSSIFKVRDNVPWQIVCMALAKISKEASTYGRLKYSLEYSYHRRVRNTILKHVMEVRWNTTAKWKPDKDFCIKVATVNGSGSQTANLVLLRSIFQMGVPVI